MLKLKYTKPSPVKVLSAVIEERKRIYVQGKRYLIISEIWIFRIGQPDRGVTCIIPPYIRMLSSDWLI